MDKMMRWTATPAHSLVYFHMLDTPRHVVEAARAQRERERHRERERERESGAWPLPWITHEGRLNEGRITALHA